MSTNDSIKSGNGAKIAILVVVLLVIAGVSAYLLGSKDGDVAPKAADEMLTTAATAPAADDEDVATDAATSAEDPVVAEVNGDEVHRSDVFDFIGSLPDHIRQMPVDNLFPMALDQVIANEVINSKAKSANIENDPEVTKQMAMAKDQIIRSVYVERQIEEKITPAELRKAYDDMVAKIGNVQETHARHVLVDTEEKAKEVIAKLDGGAKFEDLAKEYTSDPSGQDNGGDLGYFAKTDMVPEFADAAFTLEPGKYTKSPVKTQFGWHVIKVEDRRTRPAPDFEQVRPQLEMQLRQKTLVELVEGWQKEANVKKFDINGAPAAATPASTPAPAVEEPAEDPAAAEETETAPAPAEAVPAEDTPASETP